jgi:hypothetical protein
MKVIYLKIEINDESNMDEFVNEIFAKEQDDENLTEEQIIEEQWLSAANDVDMNHLHNKQ